MNQATFADILVDLYVKSENLFRAHSHNMSSWTYGSLPDHKFYDTKYEFAHLGNDYMLQIKLNMVKPASARGYKALNVWLYENLEPRRSYRQERLLWLQDDPEFGFDYRIWIDDSRYAEVGTLIRDTIIPFMLSIAPSLVLYELADV